jgi:hypothetical protein
MKAGSIIIRVLCILLLAWALDPSNPYGYYVLLRWIICPACTFLAVTAYAEERRGWVWLFGVTAGIYNPILHVHLGREIWSAVNVAAMILLAASFVIGQKEHGIANKAIHSDKK